jgi:hypothetical protein
MKYKNILIVIFIAFSGLSWGDLIEDDNFAFIMSQLEEYELSPTQAQDLIKAIKIKASKKRKDPALTGKNMQVYKRLKLEEPSEPPQGAQATVSLNENKEITAYYSPKKTGRFGVDVPRKVSTHARNRKDAIYLWTAVKNHEDEYIKYEDRINAEHIFFNTSLKKALLAIEIKIRTLIKDNPLLYKRTIYVGLCKDASQRAREHGQDLRKLQGSSEEQAEMDSSRKLRWFAKARTRGFNMRMSAVIENTPVEYIKHVEVLVGHLFNTTAKGSSLLGDGKAYADIQAYMASEKRKEKLTNLNLDSIIEELMDAEEDCMLGLTQRILEF